MSLVVHPYAAAFPMLSDDELDELADDIKANGLQHPLVVDEDGVLIDGRNRLAACERAGVEPAFVTLKGDPVAYITSANVKRRQMTKGQIGIVAIRGLSEPDNQEAIARQVGVTRSLIAEAAVIVEFAPDLADRVLAGNPPLSFDAAYREAKDRRRQRREQIAHDAELRAQAPDLAEMVTEESLTFDEAWAAYQKRTEAERVRVAELEDGRRRRNLGAAEAVYQLAWGAHETESFLTDVYPQHTDHVANGMQLTAARLDSAIATLTTLRRGITR